MRKVIQKLALVCFLIQGCASTPNYVSKEYPQGNPDISKADLRACGNEVSSWTRTAARGTTETKYSWTTNPLTGVGFFMPVEVPVCDNDCTKARSKIARHNSECMLKKGWWLNSQETTETAISNSTVGNADAAGFEISGRYESRIVAESTNSKFRKGYIELVLVQKGNKVEGSFGPDGKGKIWGRIEGDVVEFDWISAGGDNGLGEWVVDSKRAELRGTWTSSSRNRFGKWNLIRIEE